MKTAALLAVTLAASACSSNRDAGVADWSVRLVSFRIDSYSSYPPPGSSSTLSIGADGSISDSSSGTTATMSDGDRATFVSWATSQELVGALQNPMCAQVADGGYTLSLEIEPGISLGGSVNHAGCGTGPIEAVTELAFGMERKYLAGGSAAPPPGAPVIEHPDRAGRVSWDNLTVQSMGLDRTAAECVTSDVCGGLLPSGQIYRVANGVNLSGTIPDAALDRLRRQATSPELLAAWRGSCASENDSAFVLSIYLSSNVTLTTGTAGCADGPITALVDSLSTSIQSLPAATPGGA